MKNIYWDWLRLSVAIYQFSCFIENIYKELLFFCVTLVDLILQTVNNTQRQDRFKCGEWMNLLIVIVVKNTENMVKTYASSYSASKHSESEEFGFYLFEWIYSQMILWKTITSNNLKKKQLYRYL